MPPGGYFGKALLVDLSTGSGRSETIEEPVLRSYIGGAGLGTWLMHKYCPVRVEPLDPEAPVTFVFSPLVGTPLTTSAKFAVVAKSPLTGRLTDALASSHFAIAGKLTGHDAIVLRGACQEPSVVVIDRDRITIEPALDLLGLPAADAQARLRDRHGPAWRVAAIGAEGMADLRHLARNSCASCSIGCEHIYRGPGGKQARMEYENVFALGPLCGVSDADAVIVASSRCDELGLDTISTGGTIAWAMECVEKGL